MDIDVSLLVIGGSSIDITLYIDGGESGNQRYAVLCPAKYGAFETTVFTHVSQLCYCYYFNYKQSTWTHYYHPTYYTNKYSVDSDRGALVAASLSSSSSSSSSMAIIINSSFHPARDYLVLLTHCYYPLLLPTFCISDSG